MKRICVNCGSSPGFDSVHMATARRLGEELLARGCELVYGGSDVGLMGEVADTVLAGGGTVHGVIPRLLAEKVAHRGPVELHVVESMHERKTLMADLSDAFVGLPGGFGTLEEIAELLTWNQLGIMAKPVGLLDVDGYYEHLLAFLDNAVAGGFMKQEHRDMVLVARDPADLLDQAAAWHAPTSAKWVGLKRSSRPSP
ncbi:MAG: TIGR00730 family Rossman fold protein [bacterium]|nr:TIGR00730 family Rossman fold protein [bacterium]